MASGHNGKPANQGGMKPAPMSPPRTSGVPSKGEPGKSTTMHGRKTPGIGGSKKSF